MRKGVSLSFLLPCETKAKSAVKSFPRQRLRFKGKICKESEGERRGEESPSAKGDSRITRRVKAGSSLKRKMTRKKEEKFIEGIKNS